MTRLRYRRQLRIPGYDYSQDGAYFITIASHNRESLFGEIKGQRMRLSDLGMIVVECWEWLLDRYTFLEPDEYIVMPNHLHGVLLIRGDETGGSRTAPTGVMRSKPVGGLIGAFKTVSTKQIKQATNGEKTRVWQRNYYEHVIRSEHSLNRIREYISTNPTRWELDRENPRRTGLDDFDEWLERSR